MRINDFMEETLPEPYYPPQAEKKARADEVDLISNKKDRQQLRHKEVLFWTVVSLNCLSYVALVVGNILGILDWRASVILLAPTSIMGTCFIILFKYYFSPTSTKNEKERPYRRD